MQDASLGKLPLVDAKSDENDNTNDQRGQHRSGCPCKNAATEIEPGQKQSQASGKESEPRKVESTKLLQEGQVVKAGVSFRGPVANEEADCSCSPKCHLDPLHDESARRRRKEDKGRRNSRRNCASQCAGLSWSGRLLSAVLNKPRPKRRCSSRPAPLQIIHISLPNLHLSACSTVDSLGLHFLGNISLGTQYARGTVANPKPISIWATISR